MITSLQFPFPSILTQLDRATQYIILACNFTGTGVLRHKTHCDRGLILLPAMVSMNLAGTSDPTRKIELGRLTHTNSNSSPKAIEWLLKSEIQQHFPYTSVISDLTTTNARCESRNGITVVRLELWDRWKSAEYWKLIQRLPKFLPEATLAQGNGNLYWCTEPFWKRTVGEGEEKASHTVQRRSPIRSVPHPGSLVSVPGLLNDKLIGVPREINVGCEDFKEIIRGFPATSETSAKMTGNHLAAFHPGPREALLCPPFCFGN